MSAVLPVTDGLVAAYDFRQGDDPTILYDISGNGHHGTISGGVTWTGEGLRFDGVDSQVNLGDLGNLGTDYTVIAVVKPDADANQVIIGRINSLTHTNANGRGWALAKSAESDRWFLTQYDGVENPHYGDSAWARAPLSEWQILTARANASAMSLIAGIRSAAVNTPPTATAGMLDHTGDYYIGRYTEYYSWGYAGSMAYIAIYDRRLTDEEVLATQSAIRSDMITRGVQMYPAFPPMIAISLDDGGETDYTAAFKLASARNLPLTTYVNPNRIGRAGSLTWAQIHEMRAAGWGVEDHTLNHERITDLTEAELRANMEGVNAAFIAAGLPAPEHLSYPFGAHDAPSRAIIAEYRVTGRQVSGGTTRVVGWEGADDWYQLTCPAIHALTVAENMARIDDAIQGRYALMIYTHDISATPTADGTALADFEAILDYVAAKRDAGLILPVTTDGLYRAMQGIRTHPATGPMTLHGETTGATYNSTVDYVGFVWGTTRLNNPEGTAPSASGYDNHWISAAGDYREDEFFYQLPDYNVGTEYYYRAAARIDGTWYYGEELTYATFDTVSGTNGRYQAVTGTVAYDDVNKRMTITAGAGVTAKTRLKSYTQLEGAYKRKLHLPATGTDGDVVAAYFGTDPTLESGFGIGAIRTAGAWNIATIDGATVTDTGTVIADLVDGDSFYVEVERDTTHGVVWYYVYKSDKPTTASGKLFNTYQEIYDGFWFKNKGAAENSIAVSEIEDRAESIVGRTNVQVEEPFWFRDEFGEDSIGRYPHSSIWSISNGKLIRSVGSNSPIWFTNNQISNFDVTFDFKPHLTDNTDSNRKFWFVFGSNRNKIEGYNNGIRYLLYLRCSTSSTICRLDKFDVTLQSNLHNFGSTTDIFEGQEGFTSVRILLVNGALSLYINGVQLGTTYNIGENVVGYIGAYGWGMTDVYEIDNLQISGTRVYNKPIHRGAMLETYHDGTQEVVGTTFIDDCQWDRSGEYTTYNGIEVDTTAGQIVNTVYNDTARDKIVNLNQLGNGVYSCYISPLVHDSTLALRCGIKICKNVAGSSASTYIYVRVGFNTTSSNDNDITIIRVVDFHTTYLSDACLNRIIPLGEWVKLVVEFNHPTMTSTLYDLSGNIIATTTAENIDIPTSGYCGISFHPGASTGGEGRIAFRDFQFIAAESSSTDGIAACIPPIGGGARYGVEESVYNTFTTENVNKGVYLTTAKVKTTNPNADEVSLEYTNDTTSITLNTTPIDVDATYTVKTTPITIDVNETDTLRVSVKNSTTPSKPAIYVESLSLIPVSGDDVLYPQDLVFISGVKPSQKRKVEVK